MTRDMRHRLFAARETVELVIIETCLDALHVALHLEHPTLADHHALAEPTTLRRARVVDRVSRKLRAAIRSYRRAVQAAIDEEIDDLPF